MYPGTWSSVLARISCSLFQDGPSCQYEISCQHGPASCQYGPSCQYELAKDSSMVAGRTIFQEGQAHERVSHGEKVAKRPTI